MDILNGLFEFIGGCLIWLNVKELHRDKYIAGVHWSPVLFFMSWGIWNLFYYPALGQFWSFVGGVWMVVANMVWLGLLWYYRSRE